MPRNRYVGDYRLVETFDERGRVKTEREYIGKRYTFAQGRTEAIRAVRRVCVVCLAAWGCFIGAMIEDSTCMRTLYVALPFAFTALPLGLTTEAAVSALSIREPMEHRQADKLENRYPAVAFFWLALSCASLIGTGIHLITARSAPRPDILFCLLNALLTLYGGYCFHQRRVLVCRAE